MEGIPALNFFDCLRDVFYPVDSADNSRRGSGPSNSKTCFAPNSKSKGLDLNASAPWGVDYVDPLGFFVSNRARLLVLEDNDAVIHTVIKGRSQTLRHVNRTQRVCLDWLLERLQNASGISLRYVHTKQQVADVLTKAGFRGPQWDHLLKLAGLSFPMTSLAERATRNQNSNHKTSQDDGGYDSKPIVGKNGIR